MADTVSINNITISGAIYDSFSLNSEVTDTETVESEWTSVSAILAQFNGNIYSGNADLSLDNVEYLLVKRRKYGEFSWLNLYLVEVDDVDDFDFSLIDRCAAIGVPYQYVVVPIYNDLEGEYSYGIDESTDENYISTSYDGIVVLDKDVEYETFYEPTISLTKNHSKSIITTLNDRYPYVVNNSASNYYSGTVGGVWVVINNCTEWVPLSSLELQEEFMDFLVNSNFKILKIYDGHMFMVQITDSPTEDNSEAPFKHNISFNFTEVDDVYSDKVLYNNGFIDLPEEWWSS